MANERQPHWRARPRTPILNALDGIGFDTSFTRGLLRQPFATYPEFYEDAILRRTTEPDYGDIPVPKPRPAIPQAVVSTEIAPTRRDLGHVKPFNQPIPVDIATPTPRPTMAERQAAGVLTQPQPQSNRRDNAILATPKRPDMTIGMADALMSIGGAGLRGAQEGGLASLGGMFQQKDAIDEVNRTAALNAYNDQIAQQEAERKARFEQQKQDDLQAYREASLQSKKTSAKTAKQEAETQQGIASYDQAITKMEMALGDLRSGMSLSGLIDGTIGALWDRVRGNPEATSRLLLQELKVDSALIQISQTKGAISNKEMELFLSPTPDIKVDDESTWINWIERRLELARTVRNRLANGVTVENPATEEQASQFATTPATNAQTGSTSTQGDIALNPEDQALLDKYPQ